MKEVIDDNWKRIRIRIRIRIEEELAIMIDREQGEKSRRKIEARKEYRK